MKWEIFKQTLNVFELFSQNVLQGEPNFKFQKYVYYILQVKINFNNVLKNCISNFDIDSFSERKMFIF
jgi:hypothetical protein